MKQIGTKEFKEILRNGIEHLISDKQILNDINVYPVPDGDTGDNLVNTFLPVLTLIDTIKENSLDSFTAEISSHLLISAKGNSGVIFSQFFFSFAKAIKGKESLSPKEFAQAMDKAIKELYQSMSDPKEGTILTVIRETAEAFKKESEKSEHFGSIFENVVNKAKEVVERTREMLPSLKKANVVDSGGLGFFLFLKGMANSLKKGKDKFVDISKKYINMVKSKVDKEYKFSYCCQWTVEPKEKDKEFFKNLIKDYGDSIVISGGKAFLNIHIHTNEPDKVESAIMPYVNKILSKKIDDLKKQMKEFKKKEVGIVIDSTVDIPESLLLEEEIERVPVQIAIEGKFYKDYIDIQKDEIIEKIYKNKNLDLKTSQPAIGDFKLAYENALKKAKKVLVIILTSGHSGTYKTAEMAKALVKDGEKLIKVFDTKSLSGGAALFVYKALELIREGKDIEEIVEILSSKRDKIISFIYLRNLDFLVKGGRAPKFAGILTKFFRLHPILYVNRKGKLEKKFFIFGKKKPEFKVFKRFLKEINFDKDYIIEINYGINQESGKILKTLIEKSNIKFKKIYVEKATATLCVHAGPHAFGIFAMED